MEIIKIKSIFKFLPRTRNLQSLTLKNLGLMHFKLFKNLFNVSLR